MVNKLVYWAVALVLLWAGLRWFERRSLYMPIYDHYAHPGTYGMPYEDVPFTTSDGVELHGWYIDGSLPDTLAPVINDPPLPSTDSLHSGKHGPPVVLFFHGNAGNISHRIQKLRIFRGMRASVFIFDYRGYGKSRGKPSERGTYLDGLAAVDYLERVKKIPRENIVYFGHSLGCAVAVETALRKPPGGLILSSPFTSTAAMGKIVFPFLPVDWLVTYRYDNLRKIGGLAAPLLVMHSEADDIIPYSMGEELFAAAPEPKTFVKTLGDHNEGFLETPYYGEKMREFIARLQP